jgi:hypothetical protein
MLTWPKLEKGGRILISGETREPLEIGDTINFLVNERYDILEVCKVIERRDSRDYPAGNNYFYRAECIPVANPNPPVVKK